MGGGEEEEVEVEGGERRTTTAIVEATGERRRRLHQIRMLSKKAGIDCTLRQILVSIVALWNLKSLPDR